MNEDNSSNTDFTPVIEEMQILCESIDSNSERLDKLTEYLIVKDKKEDKTEELTKSEREEVTDEQAQTYEELLTDIRLEQQLTNQLLSGSFIFYGIIAGIILFKILWDKLT